MKNRTNLLFTVIAAFVAGAVFSPLAYAQFTARLPIEVLVAVGAALAVAGIAIFDYSRRRPALDRRAPVLRPAAPNRPSRPAPACVDRLAA